MKKVRYNPPKDKRVFHDYGIVIYDPRTLDVKESIYPVPKQLKMDDIKIQFGGFAIAKFDGEDPRTTRRKFVNGKIVALKDPKMHIFVQSPYYGFDPKDPEVLIPAVPAGAPVKIRIKRIVDDRYLYKNSKDRERVRLRSTAGKISKTYFPMFHGSATVILETTCIPRNSIVTIEALCEKAGAIASKIVIV